MLPDLFARMDVAPKEKAAPSHEEFFKKFKDIVLEEEFDGFRSTLGRRREFQAAIWHRISGSFRSRLWTPTFTRYQDESKPAVLMIEDVDIRCIMSLDADFDIDPQFFANYAGYKHKTLMGRRSFLLDKYHQSDTGIAGSWYVMVGWTEGHYSWKKDDPHSVPRDAWRKVSKPWKRDRSYGADRPWYDELHRNFLSNNAQANQPFKTVIACYCLSDSLRKLRPRIDHKIITHTGSYRSCPG